MNLEEMRTIERQCHLGASTLRTKTGLVLLMSLLWLGGELTAQLDSDFERVLTTYIKEDMASAHKEKRDLVVSSWPGIRSMNGVRSMVAEILKGTGGERQSRTFEILKRSEIPRDQIVTYLLESAQASRSDLTTLVVYFYLFGQYPEDERILKFLAPLLDEKAFPSFRRSREPGEESSQEDRWRLCDSVHGTIIGILMKRGEIEPGDLAVGDPGGEARIARRDANIAALKARLIKSGYLNASPSP